MFMATITVRAEIYAGRPGPEGDKEIVEFVKARIDHPFFVVAKEVSVSDHSEEMEVPEL